MTVCRVRDKNVQTAPSIRACVGEAAVGDVDGVEVAVLVL